MELLDIAPGIEVDGPIWGGAVEVHEVSTLSRELILVGVQLPDGSAQVDFITQRDADDIVQVPPVYPSFPFRRYPAGVPRLFSNSISELAPVLKRARARRRYHLVMEHYIAEQVRRMLSGFETIAEIYGVVGARNDAISVDGRTCLVWEVFGTKSQVEGDLRKLERATGKHQIPLAVVLDPEVDEGLFTEFVRRSRGSVVEGRWFRASDLLLSGKFEETASRLRRLVDDHRQGAQLGLRFVELGLESGPGWRRVADIPFCYSRSTLSMSDPVLWLDILNGDDVEHRIPAAYVFVRFRQDKPHGIPDEARLLPAAEVVLPVNDGEEGYREVELDYPVLVKPRGHQRLLLRLDRSGFAWRGEVEIGLIYDRDQIRNTRRVLKLPALSLLV